MRYRTLKQLEGLVIEMLDKGLTQRQMDAKHHRAEGWMCLRVRRYELAVERQWRREGDAAAYEVGKARVWKAKQSLRGRDMDAILHTIRSERLTRQQAMARWEVGYRCLANWLRGQDMPHLRRRG
jgi:hypothetical protein